MKALITTTDPNVCRALARDPLFVSAELFPGKSEGHRFKAGDKCILHGLEDFPEHNGKEVTIAAIREDGPHGKAYYIAGDITVINWVYEYRLQ
jgi:hypothetical protein